MAHLKLTAISGGGLNVAIETSQPFGEEMKEELDEFCRSFQESLLQKGEIISYSGPAHPDHEASDNATVHTFLEGLQLLSGGLITAVHLSLGGNAQEF